MNLSHNTLTPFENMESKIFVAINGLSMASINVHSINCRFRVRDNV